MEKSVIYFWNEAALWCLIATFTAMDFYSFGLDRKVMVHVHLLLSQKWSDYFVTTCPDLLWTNSKFGVLNVYLTKEIELKELVS